MGRRQPERRAGCGGTGLNRLLPPLACCLLLTGCDGTDQAEARTRLVGVLGELPAELDVLAFQSSEATDEDEAEAAGGAWIVLSPNALPAPDDADVGPAPVSAILTAAAAMGADAAGVGRSAEAAGSIREWSGSGFTIRVRSVETDRGTLSHVETFPL